MQIPFKLGIHSNNTPFYYFPHKNVKEAECVFIYGSNENLKNHLITSIIKNTIKLENAIWIIFGQNLGHNYNIDHYKIPIQFTNIKCMREFFNWTDQETDLYDISKEKYFQSKSQTKKELLNIIHQYCEEFNASDMYNTLENAVNKIICKNLSDFGIRFKNAIRQKKSQIFTFTYSNEKSNSLIAFIIEEIKYIVKKERLNKNKNPICFLCDYAEWAVKSLTTRQSIHDIVFSWGRTMKVTRYIVKRNTRKMTLILNDGMEKNGNYSMVFKTTDFGLNHINRLHSTQTLGKNDVWTNIQLIT